MARKSVAQAAEDQIKDQAFSELQSLIEESEKLLKGSASLVGEEGENLRQQVGIFFKVTQPGGFFRCNHKHLPNVKGVRQITIKINELLINQLPHDVLIFLCQIA